MISNNKDYRVPLVTVLGLFLLCVLAIIVGGYIHGDMHFAKVLQTLNK